jgi:multidrug transporter EmrE-like cation transporter
LGSSIAAAASNSFLRIALKDRLVWKGDFGTLIVDLLGLFRNPIFFVGMSFFVVSNVLWLLVLGSQKLSLAYPVQLGLVLTFNAVVSVLVFHESLSLVAWFGVVLISVGVFLISR